MLAALDEADAPEVAREMMRDYFDDRLHRHDQLSGSTGLGADAPHRTRQTGAG